MNASSAMTMRYGLTEAHRSLYNELLSSGYVLLPVANLAPEVVVDGRLVRFNPRASAGQLARLFRQSSPTAAHPGDVRDGADDAALRCAPAPTDAA